MRVLLHISLVLAALAPAAGCGPGDAPAGPERDPRPDVLLVTIDTLRADHVGCYGHGSAETPVLDGLAARGTRFATAIAHVPLTGPSHASILTGRTPLGHGFRDNGGFVLPSHIETAAEAFDEAGYETAAFVSAFTLDRRFGLARGFGVYDDQLPRGSDPAKAPFVERFADATTDAALRWLEARPGEAATPRRPFFLWVHYFDPHAPYEPPGDLAERFREAPYDGEVAFADRQLGRLLRALESPGGLEGTLVLVTSDHGEGLGDHGEGAHGLFLYDSTLKVPWIMAGPGVAAGRVSPTVARGIDVLPTLLDGAGIAVPGEVEGRSLKPALEGREMSDAPVYAESLYARREFGWAPLFAWRTADHKLIEAPRPELYDLARDPAETRNRAAEDAARLEGLRRTLQATRSTPVPEAGTTLAAETAERLAALGYVAGGGGTGAEAAGLRDPKDGIRLMPRLNRGMAANLTDPESAIRDLEAVLAEDPGLVIARRSLSLAYAAAGQHDRAIAELRRLEEDGHLSAADGVTLGNSLRMAGRLQEASAMLERVARENPQFARPLLSLATLRFEQRRVADAAAAYERVLAFAPAHVEALRGRGDLELFEGRPVEAERWYARALEADPGDVGTLTRLGVVQVRTGRPGEGLARLRRALERAPNDGEALLGMADALVSSGRPAEARPYFERALAAGQRSPATLNRLAQARLAAGDREGAARALRESLRLDPRQPGVAQGLKVLQGPPPR